MSDEHTNLRYRSPSTLIEKGNEQLLSLPTEASNESATDLFFQGQVKSPYVAAKFLRNLSRMVASRFHTPAAMLQKILIEADPIITSSQEALRFEGFSSCCSLYCRVDFTPESYSAINVSRGTTNVDFNHATRDALSRIRKNHSMSMAVGESAYTLISGSETLVEKKVKLPGRWLKGLTYVQIFQSLAHKKAELSRIQSAKLIRSIPRSNTKSVYYLEVSGSNARFTPMSRRPKCFVADLERLRLLEDLVPLIEKLTVYSDDSSNITVWQIDSKGMRFTLALSSNAWRGFSGEGLALQDLATETNLDTMEALFSFINHHEEFSAKQVSSFLNVTSIDTQSLLSKLAAQGLLGFDLNSHCYFNRVLPFNLEKLEKLNPRLASAKKLIEQDAVDIIEQSESSLRAEVRSNNLTYLIEGNEGDYRCTCPWYGKYRGYRGPCKHILAARLKAGFLS